MALHCSRIVAITLLCAAVANCMFYKTEVGVVGEDTKRTPESLKVESPAKLHLRDGGVVLYDEGFTVRAETIVGSGERYDLTRSTRKLVQSLPSAEVLYIEYYDRKHRRVVSTLTTVAATSAGALGTLLLYKAIFGSCPTVYTPVGEGRRLEAELFSHSISPAWESSDLDRVDALAGADGREVALDVANEALETHYIDALNLLVVDHPPEFEAFAVGNGEVALLDEHVVPLEARNSSGADVLPSIARRDDASYRSGAEMLEAFTQRATRDWIDLSVAVPPSARTMYVTVRVRNTLLATVFLYDVTMAQQGFYAIDWMAADSGEPDYAARFSEWFNDGFGMTLQLLEGGSYRSVGQLPPTGPIAWKQAAIGFAAPRGELAQLRLSFTPDNWVIDWVGVSFPETGDSEVVPHEITLSPSSIAAQRGNDYTDDSALLARDDDRYLITYPGDLYRVSFAVPPRHEGMARSYFLASAGHYVEWMRTDWIAERDRYGPERPLVFGDELLQRTVRLWLQKRDDLQARFYESRLPLEAGPPG